MSVSTNIQSITTANNTIEPKVNTPFKTESFPVKDYPSDTVEINGKKKTGKSNIAKVLIGVGLIGTLGLAIGLLVRGKTSNAKDVVNNANVKQELQQKFGEIFKKDFSEAEIDKLIENYKQIYKTDNIDDFCKKLFEQIKRDSGNENKDIILDIVKSEPGKLEYSGFSPNDRVLTLNVEQYDILKPEQKNLIFETLVHEFQHIRQYEMAYNADCVRFINARTKSINPSEFILYIENALINHPNEIDRFGGEDIARTILQELKSNNPEYIEMYCKLEPDEIAETVENIKKLFGTAKPYDKNSDSYKMGIRYLENFENYIAPTENRIKDYQEQLVEKEAFSAQYIAREILNLIKI